MTARKTVIAVVLGAIHGATFSIPMAKAVLPACQECACKSTWCVVENGPNGPLTTGLGHRGTWGQATLPIFHNWNIAEGTRGASVCDTNTVANGQQGYCYRYDTINDTCDNTGNPASWSLDAFILQNSNYEKVGVNLFQTKICVNNQ